MLSLITIGDSPTNGKPHIYVTGHADDVKAEISEITALLHSQWNCVVCYHDDPENEADDTGVLDKMNTVVLLISAKFVQEKTAAYETVFMHASKTGIPVIPIMLQKSAELDNAANKMLGDRHCLFIGQPDLGEKIKREFNRIFITDEFREEVRKCFDTTVFLSYRKYDRELAEELIRRIHGFEFCQGVSVWYDDFLVADRYTVPTT